MKLFYCFLCFLFISFFNLLANNSVENAKELMNKSQEVEFIENKGQIADQNGNVNYKVLFIAEVPYGTITISRDGISYSFIKRDEEQMKKQKEILLTKNRFEKLEEMSEPIQTEVYRVDMKLKGSNFNPKVEKYEMTEDYNNYYLAYCPDGITNVRKFKTVTLRDVYPNIDFVVYANNDGLVQYDFVVKPSANPNLINFAFEGAKDVIITADRNLKVETPFGSIEQKAPVSYQPYNLNNYLNSRSYNNNPQSLIPSPQSQFIINSDNSISFKIINYDPNKPLIIDPPTRLWGTYYGGCIDDRSFSVSSNDSNNVYIAGYTESSSGIATDGVHQSTYSDDRDGFLVKFNSDGIRQWGTYYGGSANDYCFSVSCDNFNNVFLAGFTYSTSGIATEDAYQCTFGGGNGDALLAKFNNDGLLLWGTYYGGSIYDYGYSATCDESNNIYLAGQTGSTEGIATEGSQQNINCGGGDAFLVKFNTNGERQWGTYYGGNGGDRCWSVAIDSSYFIYLAGETGSTEGIATVGSQQNINCGGGDAFLVKFNSNGERQWGTYYGGSRIDYGYSVACDALNNVYLSGQTSSISGIATEGAHQSSIVLGDYAGFLVKFNSDGERQWGSYYGLSSGIDYGYSVACDVSNNVYLAGQTSSTSGIATEGSHQSTFGGYNDAFLVKFNEFGERQWGTYYGGNNVDIGYSVVIDVIGNIFLAGYTCSENAIATEGSHQSTFGGINYWGADAFLVKFANNQELTKLEIPLISGWNLISSNILPLKPEMDSVFEGMNSIVIIKNNAGQIFSPAYGINEIGNWNITQGYYVYVTSPSILQIEGILTNPLESPINLNQGWNLVSYLRNSDMSAPDALQSISGSLIFAKDRMGNIYHPLYGINNIGNMQVGQGYWIYINAPAVLTYPEN